MVAPVFKRGFTLIELLVVIAIIGILSSVVLASLTSARARSKDTAIKTQLAQVRSQAELFHTLHGSYIGVGVGGADDSPGECLNTSSSSFVAKFPGTMLDTSVSGNVNALVSAANANRGTDYGIRMYCGVQHDRWAFAIPLNAPSSGMNGWCVDSTGTAKEINRNFTGSQGSLYSCP
jgi:prepilin-type N-terminal cleavage/methylation domain-containing protein